MRFSVRSWTSVILSLVTFATIIGTFMMAGVWRGSLPQAHASDHMHIDCAGTALCTEVHDAEQVFGEGKYVGHDEPSNLFYSNRSGSGNRMRYELTLPTDPPPTPAPGRSFNFQLHPAFWFGMAMCDTQSYPNVTRTCTPDSDSNITSLAKHPGTAFMEMQFYPPGWVPWPAGNSCAATKWCAALNIDSLSENPIQGTTLNPTCAAITGLEYVNFAFITRDGHSQAPANPVQSTVATFTPDPARDLFMNSGDRIVVTLHDTAHGLRIDLNDETTGGTGFMVASAANGFGMVKFAPPPSTECTNIPFDFHPMYSTSSEQTRVIWAAHSYNIAFADEIGHFDYCNGPNPIPFAGNCPTGNTEGVAGDVEPTDIDNNACFNASASTLVPVSGCLGTNTGFDGVPYQLQWPDGNTFLHPTSLRFTSPLTGEDYNVNYNRTAFEADTPRIEAADFGGLCDRSTGAGCTRIPRTDDEGRPLATFYPFFSISFRDEADKCVWLLGNDVPRLTTRDFGGNAQFGSLLQLDYLVFGGNGAVLHRFNDYRQIMSQNPCMGEPPGRPQGSPLP